MVMNKMTRQKAGLMAFNYLDSPLRDKSRSFPKAEGFSARRQRTSAFGGGGVRKVDNPQGCFYSLDRHKPCSYEPRRSRSS